MSLNDLARELGLDTSVAQRKAREGNFPTIWIGNQRCVTTEVAQWLRAWASGKGGKKSVWPKFDTE